jgi:hypothetical protein
MTNTKTIQYTTHKGGNTTYAGMKPGDTDFVLEVLEQGLYALLEKSNYNESIKQALHYRDSRFPKHTSINSTIDNTLGSFVAGVLAQHLNARKICKKKDFSTKQLKGITAATECFSDVDNTFPVIKFEDALATTKVTAKSKKSTVGKLFEYV